MSHHSYAPIPQRNPSLSRSIYEVIDSLGGASRSDIAAYLPTCSDKSYSKEQIDTALGNSVYRGYLIKDDLVQPTKWRIAPMEYYIARKRKRAQLSKKRRTKKKNTVKKSSSPLYGLGKPQAPKKPIAKAANVSRGTPQPDAMAFEMFALKWVLVSGAMGAVWGFITGFALAVWVAT